MKSLIVCADGTWDRANQASPTNVERLYKAIAPRSDGGGEQRAYYHPGVGTRPWERIRGGAFGYGLSRNVRDCYRFLVQNYEPGDDLYLFGFSRGAFTARSLAGFIRNAGILKPAEIARVDDGYDLYRDKDGPDSDAAMAFRTAYAWTVDTPIHFIGVWDTVGALGVPNIGLPWVNWLNHRYQFHDTQLSSKVHYAYQALAIDEARRPFTPTLWQPKPAVPDQAIEQVWFTGVHTDIGGGYPERDLADVTWHWMTDRVRSAGLTLSEAHTPLDEHLGMGPLHNSRTGLYAILSPYHRPLGVTDAEHEYIASTAAKRYGQDGYTPANVRTYLEGQNQQMPIG